MSTSFQRPIDRRSFAGLAIGVAASVALAGCSAPGASSTTQTSSAPVSTDLGTAKVTVTVLIDTPGAAGMTALGTAFTKAHPNVTIKVTSDSYTNLLTNTPRLLASGTVPDISRVVLGNLVKDKLLQPLDAYAKAYGWTSWPQSQFAAGREDSTGTVRGTGSLYAVGNGYGLTGVYYNKAVLAKLGGPVPSTLADFEALLKKAKSAGYTGIVTNGKDGGTVFPLQNLAIDYGGVAPVSDWVFNKKGANINTPAMVKAATTLQAWGAAGYFSSDVNSLDTTAAPTEFAKGKSLFYTSGNWQAPGLVKSMGSNVGFMLFPSAAASDPQYAMSASESLAIPAKATHKNAAAAFLNFIQTDSTARQITVDQFGLAPAGPTDATTPTASGAVQDTLSQFKKSVDGNGLVDFFANATTSMNNTLIPQAQLLVAGRTTPSAFAAKVQSDYTSQLGG